MLSPRESSRIMDSSGGRLMNMYTEDHYESICNANIVKETQKCELSHKLGVYMLSKRFWNKVLLFLLL